MEGPSLKQSKGAANNPIRMNLLNQSLATLYAMHKALSRAYCNVTH
jgi:hypothetical protein